VPQIRSGHVSQQKNSQPLSGLEPPIIQPVAQRYTTELSRFPVGTVYENSKHEFQGHHNLCCQTLNFN
jgi:hypothetical protein